MNSTTALLNTMLITYCDQCVLAVCVTTIGIALALLIAKVKVSLIILGILFQYHNFSHFFLARAQKTRPVSS
jgi:hypothetical protein